MTLDEFGWYTFRYNTSAIDTLFEAVDWCKENIGKDFATWNYVLNDRWHPMDDATLALFKFKDVADAVLFKLVYGNNFK